MSEWSSFVQDLQVPRGTYRTTTLYTTEEMTEEGRRAARTPTTEGRPASELLSPGRYRDWLERSSYQLPRILHFAESSAIYLPGVSDSLDVERARLWLFELPHGGLVTGLTLDVRDAQSPDEPRLLSELLEAVDPRRDEVRVDGKDLLSVCCPDEWSRARPTLGPDMHHLTMLPRDLLKGNFELDRDLAQRMVSRRDEQSREGFLTARFPPEANRYADMLVAVTPGASVVAGHRYEAEVAFMLCAVQALAALSSLRQIQRRAFDALRTLRVEDPREPDWLEESSRDLSDLELDLSFAVEAYLDVRVLIPSLPVEQYHRELVAALALPRGAEVTGGMLKRLSSAIKAEWDARLAEQRERDEQRFRTWSAIGGTVAFVGLPLSVLVTFLGMNTVTFNPAASLFNERYFPYYAGLVAIFILAALCARVYVNRVVRRQRQKP